VHEAPAWLTVTVCPPTVSVPVRELADEFADTEIVTVPAPVIELPPVTVIHAALLLAVQAQPAGAFTVTDVEVAVAPTVRTVVDNV